MAKKYHGGKMGVNFDGFLELARQIDEMGEGLLKQATENALNASKDYVNREVEDAMLASRFAFEGGARSNAKNKPASGRALASVREVAQKPVQWDGTTAVAYIAGDLEQAPEIVILTSNGNPHLKPDNRLKNAVKVKGAVRKEVNRIQQEEFTKTIKGGLKNG